MTDMTTIETADDSPSRFAINKSPVVVNLDLVPETLVGLGEDPQFRDMQRFQFARFFEDRVRKKLVDQNINAEVAINYWPNRNEYDAITQIKGPIGLVGYAEATVLEIETQVRRQFAACLTNEKWVCLYCQQLYGYVVPWLVKEVINT